mgnify:CR=1 FL=1
MSKFNKKDILYWINKELQKLTNDEDLKVTRTTKILDIPHLDSIIFVSFVISFEDKYNVKIPMDQVVNDVDIDFFISLLLDL